MSVRLYAVKVFLLALVPPVSHFPFISGPLRVQIRFPDCTGTARESNPGGPVALLVARGTLECAGSSCCAMDVSWATDWVLKY